MSAVRERWCIAIEGVLGNDGRGLVENKTTWRDPAQVRLLIEVTDAHYSESELWGKLVDFERVVFGDLIEIHATYEGIAIPKDYTISCEMVQVVSELGEGLWMTGEIAAAALIGGQTMFGEHVRRLSE